MESYFYDRASKRTLEGFLKLRVLLSEFFYCIIDLIMKLCYYNKHFIINKKLLIIQKH